MRFYNFIALVVLASLSGGCGSGGGVMNPGATPTPNPADYLPNGTTLPVITGDNVIPVTVNGVLCSGSSTWDYTNKPCVSVKICDPNAPTSCVTIKDILLDTGSYGLRVFKSALGSVSLTNNTLGGKTIAECAYFGSGQDWGTVANALVFLGSEPPVNVPIQIIDSTVASGSTSCPGADTEAYNGSTPGSFNGILGVGVFASDCGSTCATQAANLRYFTCTSATTGSPCTNVTMDTSLQVQNPVAHFTNGDQNGVVVEFPRIATGGTSSVNGYLVLGIGSRSNNQPSKVTTLQAKPTTGEILTSFGGKSYFSFLDTGSNGLVFVAPSNSGLPDCGGLAFGGLFCPASLLTFTANNAGSSGLPLSQVIFQIGNGMTIESSDNRVWVELGENVGTCGGAGQPECFFDWGLPFHLGRNVYVGITGTTSPLSNTGNPYFAY